jgi:hypothetical protein
VKSTCSWGNIQHAALRGLENSAELIISEINDRADSSIPYIKQLVKRKPSMLADMLAALHMLLAWQLKLRYAQHDGHATVAAAVAAASSSSSSSQQQQQQQHLLAQANTIPAWHERFLDALGGHVRDTFEHSERVTGPRALDDTMQALRLLLDVCANQLSCHDNASVGLVLYGRQQLPLSKPLLLLHLEAMLLEQRAVITSNSVASMGALLHILPQQAAAEGQAAAAAAARTAAAAGTAAAAAAAAVGSSSSSSAAAAGSTDSTFAVELFADLVRQLVESGETLHYVSDKLHQC